MMIKRVFCKRIILRPDLILCVRICRINHVDEHITHDIVGSGYRIYLDPGGCSLRRQLILRTAIGKINRKEWKNAGFCFHISFVLICSHFQFSGSQYLLPLFFFRGDLINSSVKVRIRRFRYGESHFCRLSFCRLNFISICIQDLYGIVIRSR